MIMVPQRASVLQWQANETGVGKAEACQNHSCWDALKLGENVN